MKRHTVNKQIGSTRCNENTRLKLKMKQSEAAFSTSCSMYLPVIYLEEPCLFLYLVNIEDTLIDNKTHTHTAHVVSLWHRRLRSSPPACLWLFCPSGPSGNSLASSDHSCARSPPWDGSATVLTPPPSLDLLVLAPLWRSRLTQGDVGQWEDPEAGGPTDNKPASRHFYPIALLLVSSHLLVVWLILSLVFLLAKYQ